MTAETNSFFSFYFFKVMLHWWQRVAVWWIWSSANERHMKRGIFIIGQSNYQYLHDFKGALYQQAENIYVTKMVLYWCKCSNHLLQEKIKVKHIKCFLFKHDGQQRALTPSCLITVLFNYRLERFRVRFFTERGYFEMNSKVGEESLQHGLYNIQSSLI